ncbi:hypothetical protein [Bradyrhizobium sp. Arg816]|uniref:hypothetical protein n=1 Tax=Bradyrhizobium sp. Arg816 TaxID=2998491 RepID=UPI00249EB633|nr:hypothetical protein [Bradyrhizobium sp. Arg816]MDI3560009.1 hypothetical protein [Bradyrhizobium sp. Arg816]
MFGRKKTTANTVEKQRPCWDEKTQASFAERDRFDVYITSVTKRTGFGKCTTHDIAGTRGYEISGLVVYPQWQAELNFDESDGEFGVWFYHSYGRHNEARQPFLEIWLSDRDYSVREAIANAHQAALVSGHKRSLVRFWKRKVTGFSQRRKPQPAGLPTVAIQIERHVCVGAIRIRAFAKVGAAHVE